MIIFVYDTGFCQTEADDPQKAVLFFHPHWVSDQQRLALCGQLMGAAHFCATVFSCPKVLTLQCGKFVLKRFGRYLLSVGSDQTLPEWILQERFNTLELLFQFYHNSFDSVFSEVKCDQEVFSKKLTDILGVFIPFLQCVICAFGNVFLLKSPTKKSSSEFLEAFQLLEACCNFKGVLGGVILHNSRVIATQLDPDLTKLLALTNKFCVRTYAEHVKLSFHLPVGVQLLKVYLKQKIFDSLQCSTNFKHSIHNGLQKRFLQKASKLGRKKKEHNKIFTVKEEDCNSDLPAKSNEKMLLNFKERNNFKCKKMKLKFESNFLKENSKSILEDLNIKVCSTPTIEKTLIHEDLHSICNSIKIENNSNKTPNALVPDVVQDTINSKHQNGMLPPAKFSHNKLFRMSMDDLMVDFTHKSYPVPLRYYNFGLAKTCQKTELPQKEETLKRRTKNRVFYKTIADPLHPLFRCGEVFISRTLHNTYLDEHYKDLIAANITIDSREEFLKSKNLMSDRTKTKIEAKSHSNNNSSESFDLPPQNVIKEKKCEVGPSENKMELTRANQKAFRRSLSLPLKPLSEKTENTANNSIAQNKLLFNKTPTTPLTTKLSLLSFEEQQFDVKPLPTPNDNNIPNMVPSRLLKNDESENNDNVPSNLFICGHQNMTIMLLLSDDFDKNQDLILSLWETSSESLKSVERLRNKSLGSLNSTSGNSASYSSLAMDSNWGAIQRSGSWGDDELKIVGSLYNDLNKLSNVTEIIIRNEDSVIYGYSCGGTKIFYQQRGCSSAGLPTPADLMGVITLKARRRLERDRDIVLL